MGLGSAAGNPCVERELGRTILHRVLPTFVFIFSLMLALLPETALAQSYRFNSVRVEGNQRIEAATIVAYTGIERGKSVSAGE